MFADMVRIVHGISQGGARELLREHDLTPAQYQVLRFVHGRPGCQQQEVSNALGTTRGNVSMLVTRMEGAGYLDRVPDGASSRLRLTPAGEKMLRILRPAHSAYLADQFAVLDDEQLRALAATLRALDTR